jgi:hypothetical protein
LNENVEVRTSDVDFFPPIQYPEKKGCAIASYFVNKQGDVFLNTTNTWFAYLTGTMPSTKISTN